MVEGYCRPGSPFKSRYRRCERARIGDPSVDQEWERTLAGEGIVLQLLPRGTVAKARWPGPKDKLGQNGGGVTAYDRVVLHAAA